MTTANNCLIDIGNTLVKIAISPFAGTEAPYSFPTAALLASAPTPPELGEFIDWLNSHNLTGARAFVSSVVPTVNSAIEKILRTSSNCREVIFVIPQNYEIVANDLPNPRAAGSDLLLAARVIAEQQKDENSRRSTIIVHCGSAIVITLLTADGTYGGAAALMPSAPLLLNSLATAALLPQLTPTDFAEFINSSRRAGSANNTTDAIFNGVYAMISGGISETIKRVTTRLGEKTSGENLSGENPRLIFSGGDAEKFSRNFPDAEVIPNLVLRGLEIFATGFNVDAS